MLLTEIQKSIFNTAKGGGLPSDDSRLNGRLIEYWIRYYRAFLMPQFTDFGKIIYPEIVQDLGCLTLTTVDKAECPSTIDWGENIKKVTIPSLIDLPENRGLVFVGFIDKQKPITITTAENIYWTQFRRFTANNTRAFMIGSDLYINSPDNAKLTYINVRGVFDDPTAITTKDSKGATVKFNPDKDSYPIPEGMVSLLVENILNKELNVAIKTNFDVTNNALQDTEVLRPAAKR